MIGCQFCGSTDIASSTRATGWIDYRCKGCGRKNKPVELGGSNNILFIGDVHLPFVHKDYLNFLKDVKEQYDVTDNNTYCVGDIVDNHASSFHQTDVNGMSAGDELDYTRSLIQEWGEAFPKMKIAFGNHDQIPARQLAASGLPRDFLRNIKEVYNMPDGWDFRHEWSVGNAKLIHGTGFSGMYAHATAARGTMGNVILGHLHSVAGVHYIASDSKLIYGLSCGCGVDRDSYAMAYGKYFPRKPILGCGLLLNGKIPIFIPMDLGEK